MMKAALSEWSSGVRGRNGSSGRGGSKGNNDRSSRTIGQGGGVSSGGDSSDVVGFGTFLVDINIIVCILICRDRLRKW